MAASAERIKRRNSELTAARQLHQDVWRRCADLTFPERAHGLDTVITNAGDAQQRKAIIYDGTAADACKTGAATVMGSTMPASAQWFGLDIGPASTEEDAYMERVAKFMWQNIHASNFDAEAMDAMLDLMWAGWHVLYCEEAKGGGFAFELWPVGQCRIASSQSGMLIDTVYREWEYTVSQCVAAYGAENGNDGDVSKKVRDAYIAGKFDEKVRILHAIEPRALYVVGSKLASQLPFSSCHIEIDNGHVLRESGYHEFPCMVPRWSRLPGSSYATGPMSDALPDANTLNEVVRFTLLGAETAIAPMMKYVDDGVVNVRNMKMGPRKWIACADVDNIQPINTGARVDAGILVAERLQGSIRKILFADQMPPADGPVKTAYEWSVRVDMMRRLLGPMFARFQAEFLSVLITRTFGIAWRANEATGWALFGEPPESLVGRNFVVRYMSPLARAQRMDEVAALDRYEQSIMVGMQVDPAVADVYDSEEGSRERSRLLGVPQRLMNDPKKVASIRQARVDAQAKQQEQALAAQGQVAGQDAMAQRMVKAA